MNEETTKHYINIFICVKATIIILASRSTLFNNHPLHLSVTHNTMRHKNVEPLLVIDILWKKLEKTTIIEMERLRFD